MGCFGRMLLTNIDISFARSPVRHCWKLGLDMDPDQSDNPVNLNQFKLKIPDWIGLKNCNSDLFGLHHGFHFENPI